MDKYLVHGRGPSRAGRLLHVLFVLVLQVRVST